MFLPRSLSRKAPQPSKRAPHQRKPLQGGVAHVPQDNSELNNQEEHKTNTKPENDQDIGTSEAESCSSKTNLVSTGNSEGPSGSVRSQPDCISSSSNISEDAHEYPREVHAETDFHSEVQPGGTQADNEKSKLNSKQSSSEDRTQWESQDSTHGASGENRGHSSVDEDPVVSYSKGQRWPEEGEPVCVICGRYGEYICDKAEVDVCSLECKARNLARQKQDHRGEVMKSEESKAGVAGGDFAVFSYSYTECLEVARLSREEVQDIRTDFDIFVEGIDVPRPVLAFEQLFLPPKLLQNLKGAGYVTPTPVQMQIIPAALKCRDLMVCAQTSSGKTASFLIPSILHVLKYRRPLTPDEGPITLILTPTRELAQQIETQAKIFMEGIANMRTALLVGGLPLPPQIHRLKQNIQLVIATPGRLLEIIREGELKLSSFRLLVIDEVDTMLRFGFQKQVEDIRSQLSGDHQTMLFSATIPAAIERITELMLNDPVYVSIGTPSTPCSSVKQILLWVEEPSKKKMLFNLLEDSKHYKPPVLVFVDSKVGADLLAGAIEKVFGLDVGSIHGNKTQVERYSILQAFQEGLIPILVSTGVLGRGLDLPKVKLVINFDMPKSVEEYIHQIGRTSRLGSKGTAISFINNGNQKLFLELQKTLEPLGVSLPPELTNSPFLQLQKEEHQRKGMKRNTSHPGRSWKEFKKRKR